MVSGLYSTATKTRGIIRAMNILLLSFPSFINRQTMACTVFLLFSIYLHAAETPSLMTLGECQARALQTSEALSIAEIETLIAKEKIREIQGIDNPKLSVESKVTKRNNHSGRQSLKNPHPDKESNIHNPSHKQIWDRKTENNSRISLIVPIYDSGLVSNKKASQEYAVEASVQDRARVEQTLLQEVAQSYFTILESQKIEQVVQQSLTTLEKEHKTSEDLLSVGLITKHDLLVMDVQIAQRQEELIQAQNNIETAKASLNRLMCRELQTALNIQDVSEETLWDENYFLLTHKADLCHPELKRIEAKKEALPYDYKAIRAERLPQVKAFFDYNNSSNCYLLHQNWVTGSIGIQIPILDGGIVESKLRQKEQEMSEATLRLKQAKEDIHLDIKKSYLKLGSTFHKIPVALKAIRESEENLRMSQDLYQEGLLSSDDLMNDEQRLTQAKARYYQALYQWYMAKSSLQYAAGIIKPEKTS